MSQEQDPLPIVHVLISEAFFREKVDGALYALKCEPRSPDWGGDLAEQLAVPAVGIVADLEDEKCDVLAVLRGLPEGQGEEGGEGGVGDKAGGRPPILGYCSHNRDDLMRAAEALGAKVVARSTFAANLVRLLMELVRPNEEIPEPGREP